jgi:hypothetical protein
VFFIEGFYLQFTFVALLGFIELLDEVCVYQSGGDKAIFDDVPQEFPTFVMLVPDGIMPVPV